MSAIVEEAKLEESVRTISSYRESEYTDHNNLTNVNLGNLKDMLQDSMNENLAESVYPVDPNYEDGANMLSIPENQSVNFGFF